MAKRLGKKKVNKAKLGDSINNLDFLIPQNIDQQMAENPEQAVKEMSQKFAMIPITQIQANPDQPRREFEKEALEELAASIKIHGVIQPLTLRRLEANVYQIISGERRWRASQLAEITEVPAYIRVVNDQELMEMALIENIQREDLNPFEIAVSYYRLKDEFDLIDEELATRVGKKRSTITHYLGLLDMDIVVIESLKKGIISMGHAKAIKGVDKKLQKQVLDEIVEKKLNVRDAEKLAKTYSKAKSKSQSKTTNTMPDEYKEILQNFKEFFGSGKIKINVDNSGKGQIVIPFDTTDQLEHFYKCVEQ
jgi:ParB family chromosome partitioning protein